MNIVGVLLAAGSGSRFGSDKRRVPVDVGTQARLPVAVAACRNLCAAVPMAIAVVRRDDEVLATLLREAGASIVECARADEGMGASLASAVAATPDADGWIVALADMPWVQPSSIAQVAAALVAGASIAAPFHRGRRGHPVGFSSVHRDALLALSGDEGARRLLATSPLSIVHVDVDDPGVNRDVDVPADLGPGG